MECIGGSDLVHLVDSDGQLSDTERAHQQGVFSGLTAGLEPRLKLPAAGVHHQHSHIGLHRGHEGREFISSVQSVMIIVVIDIIIFADTRQTFTEQGGINPEIRPLLLVLLLFYLLLIYDHMCAVVHLLHHQCKLMAEQQELKDLEN